MPCSRLVQISKFCFLILIRKICFWYFWPSWLSCLFFLEKFKDSKSSFEINWPLAATALLTSEPSVNQSLSRNFWVKAFLIINFWLALIQGGENRNIFVKILLPPFNCEPFFSEFLRAREQGWKQTAALYKLSTAVNSSKKLKRRSGSFHPS